MKETVVIDKNLSVAQILQKIMALPPLKAGGFRQIDPRESLICLQAECGVLNNPKYHEDHEYKYIGTISLLDCIFILIKNESNEYFFSHIDRQIIDRRIKENLFEDISKFKKSSKSLEVTLIGGKKPSHEPSLDSDLKSASKQILENIIKQLIGLTEQYTIKVVGQMLVEHYDRDTKYTVIKKIDLSMPAKERFDRVYKKKEQIYQEFCELLPILFFFLYRKIFNSSFIDDKFPTPDSLIRDSNINRDTLKKMNMFSELFPLLKLQQFSKITNKIKENLPELEHKFNKSIVNFYNLVSRMMCVAGALFLETRGLGKQNVKLIDFVIQLDTGKIFKIPTHIKTYNQELRKVQTHNQSINEKYFLFFSHQQYNPISRMDQEVEDEYNNAQELVKTPKDYSLSCFDENSYLHDLQDLRRNEDYLHLHSFREKWKDRVPSVRDFNIDILFTRLTIFSGKLGSKDHLKDRHLKLISEYATGDSSPSML